MPDTTTTVLRERLQDYYGRTLQGSRDLKTSACCCDENSMPQAVRGILRDIHPEIRERFYGCGSPLPPLLDGMTVLDLGCGTGRDVYVASRLVGEKGRVIGIDMTGEQIEIARRHSDWHARRFGYGQTNAAFHQGYIEDLQTIGIPDASVDVVISNCVINLSPCKEQVLAEVFRVLKPGGELYFSDVFADRRIPRGLIDDPVLQGECLAGAMYSEDFRRLMARTGWADLRTMNCCPITLEDAAIVAKIGMVGFTSRTVRAFKLSCLEDICEDYGQVACYLGSIPGHPHWFDLDDHHRLFTGKPMLVCGNTAAMLSETRFGAAFRVIGDRSVHYGAFDCGSPSTCLGEDGGACC